MSNSHIVVGGSRFRLDDKRLVTLRDFTTEQLIEVLVESVSKPDIISPIYFAIGMNPRFMATTTEKLRELIVAVLLERRDVKG